MLTFGGIMRAVLAFGCSLTLALGLAAGVGATAQAGAPTTLEFAAFNVCKATCEAPAPSWEARRGKVARVIADSGADVVALNEATNQPVGQQQGFTKSGRPATVALTQWDDIRRVMAPDGYSAPITGGVTCAELQCTHTARLLFREATVEQVDLGPVPSAGETTLSAVTGTHGVGFDRQMSWAYLQARGSSDPFLAISVHLDNDKSAAGEQARLEFGRGLDLWIARLNASHGMPAATPSVLLGDLNSFEARQPRGVQKVLADQGWKDAWNAPTRVNVDINSVNYSPTSRSGWPAKPLRNPSGVASRIDYILFKGPGAKARSYEVVVHLTPSGTYAPDYRASDHNMVLATLTL